MNASVPNADPAELQRFADVASRWWDPQGAMAPLHAINPLRLEWIARQAQLPGARVLDVGCGGGVLAEAMAARGAHVTGIDLSTKLLRVAELHALESGVAVEYHESAAEAWAEAHAGAYDVVTCMEMLEHVPDPSSVVRAVARLVRPGGQVFFSTINRNPKAFLFAVVGVEYVLNMLPRGTHEYAKFIRPAELARWARDAGLVTGEMAGLTYNPLTRHFAMTADTSVNYFLACRAGV
ncbi:MAG TPA: bifunctional 2-polyprenyl-6-hydroxyphenol methylase/3-demethylubiquinol 3-O-methyltransferase UbiG [Burkholderiaceae bacterium]|jgi:2-polyprenyl-6-hydroxyphenyl methylase/3-demethylubiquinone-9 3-methyltransferase|nr:bifunctional 2-polyprenyl-6-hydroxyphenol methylase/3-demethylubiquinol 3-O-methyltransferase UbiG [Burkholderiaceae bacterium]